MGNRNFISNQLKYQIKRLKYNLFNTWKLLYNYTMNQQEFKDRVANLLIDARVNAVLAETEAKPEGG